jgi:thiol-disulfide isomerase/thioredoxin
MKFLLFLLVTTASAVPLVNEVRESIARNDLPRASEMIRAYRASKGVTPEAIEALSWLARGELAQKNLVQADKYAQETYRLSLDQLKTHPLAHDANLQIALGGAIEVEATVLATRGQRAEAITYLQEQLKTYYATPLRPRIQKNINVLSLEGKRAPALERVTIPAGRPVLVFFWAHWCGDCKAEVPILARLMQTYGPRGLLLVAPTQLYGFTAAGDATPESETRYIEEVRKQFYAPLAGMPVPLSVANFDKYGCSTTPTLVLLDANGIVRLYHPGAMTYDALAARVKLVTTPRPSNRNSG